MATIQEYFDGDFNHAVRIHVKLIDYPCDHQAAILYDFSGFIAFVACYLSGSHHKLSEFVQLVKNLKPGQSPSEPRRKSDAPVRSSFPRDIGGQEQ
jgi:hypothetical protein